VGHPAGNLWSFTRGVVSAVHRGAVQHDASANGGNSGGPLLDMQGRLVGINTFKLLEAAGQVVDGISYARPMSIAAPLYDDEAVFPMDLSSPESSIRSFWMAVELGRVEALNAVDMQASWELFKEANLGIKTTWYKEDFPVLLEEAGERYGLSADSMQMMQEGMAVSFEAYLREIFDDKESKDDFLVQYRAGGEALILGTLELDDEESFEENLELMFEELEQEATDERRAEIEAYQSSEEIVDLMKAYAKVVNEMPGAFELACGLTADVENPRTLTDLLRLGMSVDAVRLVNEGQNAWVLTTGVQADGQPFGCSNYFRKSGESWLQDSLPKEADIRTLPSDFPGVRRTYETELAAYEEAVSSVLRQVETTTFWLGMEVALGEGTTED